MPNYVFYDAEGKIYKKKHSLSSHIVEEGLIEGYERALQIDEETYQTLTIYKKVENGFLVDMIQQEKDALDVELAQDAVDKLIAQIEKHEVTTLQIITALVKVINVRIPSNVITKAEVIAQLRSDLGV